MNQQNYFNCLDEIESKWRKLKKEKFPQKLRDEFWRLCLRGQEAFWQQATKDKQKGYPMVKTVPAYERAVMLLEHEGKHQDAIRMCEEANKWGIDTDWYNKRIVKLQKKIKK